jgi:hypothetical protein
MNERSPDMTPHRMLLDCQIGDVYLTVFHMIGWQKMNERSPDMTPHRKLLDCQIGDVYLTVFHMIGW